MPADFEIAIQVVLTNEGGYVANASDPGGETNFGISKRAYPDVDIRHLTADVAKEIYRRDYWRYGDLNSQGIATKLLDMSVNMGRGMAVLIAQHALVDLGVVIATDGIWGPKTEATLNSSLESEILPEIRVHQTSHYVELVAQHPEMYQFMKGWLRRVNSC